MPTVTWNVRIPEELRDALLARADLEQRSAASIVARVLGQAAKRWQNTAPAANHRDER